MNIRPFSIQHRAVEGIYVLEMDGTLVSGDAVEMFRAKVDSYAEAGTVKLIANLRKVPYIDSSALGALIYSHRRLEQLEGGMRLLNLNTRNLELMVLTKLETVFSIFNDEQQAVNSFFANRDVVKFDILAFLQSQKKEKE